MHVLVDIGATRRTVAARWTEASAHAFVEEMLRATGLKAFGPRVVVLDDQQLRIHQMIAESHVSGHLDLREGRGWLDIFSCRYVGKTVVVKAVQRHFLARGQQPLNVCVLDRGRLPG